MAMDPLFSTPLVPKLDPAETRSSASVRAIFELVERGDLHVHAPGSCSSMQGTGSVAGLYAVLCRFWASGSVRSTFQVENWHSLVSTPRGAPQSRSITETGNV
jgi:hypothetical protein